MISITSIRTTRNKRKLATYAINGKRAASFVPTACEDATAARVWLTASIREGKAAAHATLSTLAQISEPVEEAPALPRKLGVGRASTPTHLAPDGQAALATSAHTGWSKGWCARIIGKDSKYGLARTFERAAERGLSRAGNGVLVYHLTPGLYEAESVYKSAAAWRYYVLVHPDGGIEEITKEHALGLVR